MIDPKTLTPADVGREVIYTPTVGEPERGTLTSWNEHYVFARFRGPGGESCRPEDLCFAVPSPPPPPRLRTAAEALAAVTGDPARMKEMAAAWKEMKAEAAGGCEVFALVRGMIACRGEALRLRYGGPLPPADWNAVAAAALHDADPKSAELYGLGRPSL